MAALGPLLTGQGRHVSSPRLEQRARHMDGGRVAEQVEVLPAEREHLSDAHAGAEQDVDQVS